jgi:hypothetical protein
MDVISGRDLRRLRLGAEADLSAALGRLRTDARAHLARRPGPGYPDALTVAATELGRRYLAHVRLAADPGAPDPAWRPPPLPPPPDRRRWSTEQLLFVVGAVPAAVWMIRLAWSGGPPPPIIAGTAAAGALAVALWAADARRARADRDRLDRWTGEVLSAVGRSLQTAVEVWLLDRVGAR